MNGLKGARVLLTGGSGFIGGHLAQALAAAGANVYALARPSSDVSRLAALGSAVRVVAGDLGDASSLAACLETSRPQIVFHLAKERGGVAFEEQARATLRLAAALSRGAPELRRLVRTAHDAGPAGSAADAGLAETLRARYGLPVVTLELFQVYGPGQPRGAFPLCLLDAAAPPCADDAGLKDFVHVRDVARAYLLAAERPGLEGARVPIGSGRGWTLGQARELFVLAAPRARPLAPSSGGGKARGGHPADLRAALELLGWRPEISLADGFLEMMQ